MIVKVCKVIGKDILILIIGEIGIGKELFV